jgi:parallel beta helix pectate lyase-like protein
MMTILIFLLICLTSISANATTVIVTWSNSINEQGFNIERKVDTGAYSQLGQVGAKITAYSDTTAVAGSKNCYRVNAYNRAGVSPYSNEACVDLAKAPPAPTNTTATEQTAPPPPPPPPPPSSANCDSALYPCAASNIRTVDVNGSAEFQTALSNAQPGDTIRLRAGGSYTGADVAPCPNVGAGSYCITRSGTQSQPITITTYPNESAVLNAQLFVYGGWVRVTGLELTQMGNGIAAYGGFPTDGWNAAHLAIVANNIHDTGYMGIFTSTVSYLLIEQNNLNRNGLGPGNCSFPPAPPGEWPAHCHGLYFSTHQDATVGTTGLIFRRNRCIENAGSCVQIRNDGPKTIGALIENNLMVNGSSGINYSDCDKCIARNNTVYMASYPMPMTNAAQRCFVMNHLPGSTLANNVCYVPMESNLTQSGSPNVIYPIDAVNTDATPGNGTVYSHNAFYVLSGIPWQWTENVVLAGCCNLLAGYQSGTGDPAPVLTAITSNSNGSEAGFVNAPSDFHLTASSPLRGAGLNCPADDFDGNLRTGCNIGAF